LSLKDFGDDRGGDFLNPKPEIQACPLVLIMIDARNKEEAAVFEATSPNLVNSEGLKQSQIYIGGQIRVAGAEGRAKGTHCHHNDYRDQAK
jgi:hypothetical protein